MRKTKIAKQSKKMARKAAKKGQAKPEKRSWEGGAKKGNRARRRAHLQPGRTPTVLQVDFVEPEAQA